MKGRKASNSLDMVRTQLISTVGLLKTKSEKTAERQVIFWLK
jgi:hypothetical protein